jgi:hypothetical protein
LVGITFNEANVTSSNPSPPSCVDMLKKKKKKFEAGGSSLGSMGKEFMLGGSKKTFSEVVGKMGQLEWRFLASMKAG